MLLGQIFLTREIDCEADQHANARRAEPPVPANFFTQRSNDEGGGDHAGVDAEIEDLERIGPPQVAR